MSKRSIVLAVGVIAAIASLIVGSAASAKGEATAAGTVVFVHDQEPGILNLWLSTGNGYVNSITTGPVLATGAVYNDKAKLVPFLMESVPKVVKAEPLTVTGKFKQSAVWSDGKPITAQDLVATWRTIMNPNWDITSR